MPAPGRTMRLGLLADAHGNSVALTACLEQLEAMSPDQIYFLGDAVGYLPDAAGCLAMLEEAGAICQQGNHEAMLLAPETIDRKRDEVYRLRSAREHLAPELLRRIEGWPVRRPVSVDGRRLLLVHGSPVDPLNGYVYADREPERFIDPAYDAIIVSHTHRPFALRSGGRLLLNVGSVGLPRDQGNLASFGVYDGVTGEAAIYRVAFDVGEVIELWGPEIHAQTAACLARTADAFEGERIA